MAENNGNDNGLYGHHGYESIFDSFSKLVAKFGNFSKKDRGRTDFWKMASRKVFAEQKQELITDYTFLNNMIAELFWIERCNRKVLFVDDTLRQMLEGMKVENVQWEDIAPAYNRLHGAFVMDWGGEKCLVYLRKSEDMDWIQKAFDKVTDDGSGENRVELIRSEREEMNTCLQVFLTNGDRMSRIGLNLPQEKMGKIANEDIAKHSLSYIACDEEENISLKLWLKRVMRALVYLAAFPDSLRDGCPKGKEGELTPLNRYEGKRSGAMLYVRAEHASPSMHLRQAHYRMFPIRRDGSRRRGLVLVRMCVVNGTSQTEEFVGETIEMKSP